MTHDNADNDPDDEDDSGDIPHDTVHDIDSPDTTPSGAVALPDTDRHRSAQTPPTIVSIVMCHAEEEGAPPDPAGWAEGCHTPGGNVRRKNPFIGRAVGGPTARPPWTIGSRRRHPES